MSQADRAKWDERYRARGPDPLEPSPFVLSLDCVLPRQGRALDVGGGAGRHAIWLAQRGLDVLVADVSEVGLSMARGAAAAAGVRVGVLPIDLEEEPLPPGPWTVVLSYHFLHRALFQTFPRILAPGGYLVCVQPTKSNLLRHQHPSERYLLNDGELKWLSKRLEVVRYEEGWFEDRHEARVLARRPV